MKLSTKGRYGLRALIDLAAHQSLGHQSLYNIAKRQKVSEIYLEQVFSVLRKNGIVKSVKGAQGGYFLNADPEKTTVKQLVEILEGDLRVVDPIEETDRTSKLITKCLYERVWQKVDRAVEEMLENITLEDMVQKYHKTAVENMYYI